MSAALSVLLLEDDPSSIRLFNRKAQSAPVEIAVKDVRNKESFIRELEDNKFDCIVIDYTLPDLDGLTALRLIKEMASGTPAIIYTGSVGEEKAVECMKEGAAEFLLKTNSIRLVPAILSVVSQRRDHEARVRAEEAQKQSETLFRTLAETSTAAIFIFQGERFIYINPISEQMSGYTHDELMNMRLIDIVHPDYQDILHQRNLARQRGEDVPARYEFKIITKDGRHLWLDFAAGLVQYKGAPAGIGIAFDVTSRKEAEEKLQTSELRYRTLFEANPHPMWVYDIDTLHFLAVNDAAVQHYGYSRNEFLSMTIKDIRPSKDIINLENRIQRRKEKEGLDEAGIWKHQKKNGEVMEVEIVTHTLEFGGHRAKMVLATDITERRRAEKALQESEANYRSLFESARDVVFTLSMEGIVTALSPSFEITSGWRREEWIGKNIVEIIHPDDQMLAQKRIKAVLSGEVPVQLEYRIRRSSGDYLTSEIITSRLICEGKVIGLIGTARDVTKHRKLEQQFRQAQKMESIGTLAGGIAHDFNNILAIVSGYAAMAERHLDEDGSVKQDIEIIKNASDRGAVLVHQLMTFARKSPVIVESINVNTVVNELVQLLSATFPKNIEIIFEVNNNIPNINADQNQLHQALLNLAVNSRDAMSDGGKLRFMTDIISGEKLRERIQNAQASEYICIAVIDNGCGMNEETKNSVFDPFFTTKQKGKGTGLGLAVVYGIIGSHNGYIITESEVGKGTTMHIYLPVSLPVTAVDNFETEIADIPGGKETILIVEDEYSLRHYLKALLEEKGYIVLDATDGLKGFEVFEKNFEQISLVISDLGMPKLNGLGFIRRILEIKPKIKTVITSGFIDPDQRSEILHIGVKDFFQKPYKGRNVLLRIREILDSAD